MNLGSYILALLAGALTTLSPCVLPVLPLVFASSLRAGRRGPIFFVLGLITTFVGVTWLLSSFGSVLGLERNAIRYISGTALIFAGILYLSEKAQEFFSKLMAPLVDRAGRTSTHLSAGESQSPSGIRQFFLGALTGIIWTPCSGPSLGVAIGLAAERQNPIAALTLLLVFGIGAAIPMLVIAYSSERLTRRLKGATFRWAAIVKKSLGLLIIVIGIGVLSGLDKSLEAMLVGLSPDWLTDLTTRF